MAKVAQQVLLSLPEKVDVMLLAVARQESQAEVVRTLIAAGKSRYLRAQATEIEDLMQAFRAMNVEPAEALSEMLAVKVRYDGERRPLRISDLRAGFGYSRVFPAGATAPAE